MPKRKELRLKGYDYSLAGGYFVTVYAAQRRNVFGVLTEGEMVFTQIGEITKLCWYEIPSHFPYVILDEFVIMPDHLHGIIFICETNVGERHASPVYSPNNEDSKTSFDNLDTNRSTHASPRQDGQNIKLVTLGEIVASFKSAVTKKVNLALNSPGKKLWQRGYYDRIIRNETELTLIRDNILNIAVNRQPFENYLD